jgi:hypothetical protein
VNGRRPRGTSIIQRADKAITPPGNGFDELGLDRGIAKDVAQSFDDGVQAMLEVAEAGAGPQFLLKFFAGYELTWFLQ